jgi:uncharacterized SAM-binding protein YcdF (DUF218 family)
MVSTQQSPPSPEPIQSTSADSARSAATIVGRFGGVFALGGFAGLLLGQIGVLNAVGLHKEDPMTVALFATLALGLGFLRIGPRVLFVVDGALFCVYLVVALSQVVSGPASKWVRADSLPPRPFDAVVVLSSGVRPDSSIDVDAVDRMLTGLALVKAGAAPRLITTRTEVEFNGHSASSDPDQLRLIRLAGVEAGWTVVDSVYSTRDEAVRIAQRLLPSGPKTIAVVTSPMHTRRACQVFEAVGFRVYCVPAREHEFRTWHPKSPSDRLAASREYLYERLGMVKYRWKGWLPAHPSASP